MDNNFDPASPMEEEGFIPVYVIGGFLESGKTTFLQFTLEQDYFAIDGTTLLIVCEEGEVEYDRASLKGRNVVMEVIESQEDFTPETLLKLDRKYMPERIVMEYNGMWLMSALHQMKLPSDWIIEQQIICVDAGTFQLYMQNWKSIFMDMVRTADMVIFNRATTDMPLANYRRSIKVEAPSCEVTFESNEGILNIFTDETPYDLDADPIEISLVDFGIWYVDSTEKPDRYDQKHVVVEARLAHHPKAPKDYFQMGRPAMTCCSDDISMLGFICRMLPSAQVDPMDYISPKGVWARIEATISIQRRREYNGEEGPVLLISKVTPCEPPKDELVYFN